VDDPQRSRWRPSRRLLLWAAGGTALAFLVVVVCGYLFGWKWTGLPKKTLWDWLSLLIIPAVLAGVGLWFNSQQREQELQTADRRAQDEALQAYLDQMSAMLIPDKEQPSLYDEQPPDSLKTVARARTLTVLPRLNGAGKQHVVQFLYEAGVIGKRRTIVDLGGEPDLSSVNLRWGADLRGASLSRANLNGANLGGVNLSEANLDKSYLMATHLSRADLSGADLSGANLSGADLSGARLQGAYLVQADLSEAAGWTAEQLDQAKSLKGATMPDGQVLKGHVKKPNGPTFKDWLKDRDRHKEDRENE
jgi:hypothetical protein